MAADYELCVTVREPRERATQWHATDLCRHCGSCVVRGTRGDLCPGKLDPSQVRSSPQGYGPARNIIAFTGGDLTCRAEFYAQATERIKQACQDKMWVLLETNGYGLTPGNLDTLASAGLDSFWLDIKAHDRKIYRRLCGTRNESILEAPARILDRGFVLEVLSLYIPGWVETDQLVRIAELLRGVDAGIPFTILAFFPEYKLGKNRPPTLMEMLHVYSAVREVGLKRVKLGNCGVFARSGEEWNLLIAVVGREGLG
jgi:pyruvate-formate lyase-activating enzyme